mmetsp:Transcript_51247/g.101992  ORF Transcript_51247/g.101992 Transcript_51247/m.101992 type:complete len:228 (-) Transcript_51247:1175-1858(-)
MDGDSTSLFSMPGALASMTKPSPRGGRGGGGDKEKRKQCNCRNSRCLKLYCECFASGQYCSGCNCQACHNNPENDDKRRKAIDATLERNPQAFRPKIAHGGISETSSRHNKGCHCKKSNCLKKYCECFQANIVCSESCKCTDCKNREGDGRLVPAPSPAPKRQRTAERAPKEYLNTTPMSRQTCASDAPSPPSASDYPVSNQSALSVVSRSGAVTSPVAGGPRRMQS